MTSAMEKSTQNDMEKKPLEDAVVTSDEQKVAPESVKQVRV